ncbi:MAG: hypothetical protein JNK60_01790 [Acidobacteria bacterium]|nr:hypothetical protein [Acidobacteriota bacterium]
MDLDDLEQRGSGVPFSRNRTRSVGLTVPVRGDGFLGLRASLPLGGTTHAIVDVSGYFR